MPSAAQPASAVVLTPVSSATRANSSGAKVPGYICIGANASLCAMASTWVGLRVGPWMRGVQR
jgi:hypothetical protein